MQASAKNNENVTVIHLFQVSFRGGSPCDPPKGSPFIWIHPVDVEITGSHADRFDLPRSRSLDLSEWQHTSYSAHVLAEIDEPLLAAVIEQICDPMLGTVAKGDPAF